MNDEELYSKSLAKARDFLGKKKTTASGTKISESRLFTIVNNHAQCPQCGIPLRGANHNTEHIHPRSLGGGNDDANKIQICISCNHSRNMTMQAILGHPPYHKKYPDNWELVQSYILWAERTIDYGLQSGMAYPGVHTLFMDYRFGNSQINRAIERFYGRVSTWKKGALPQTGKSQLKPRTSNLGENQTEKKTGIFTKIFDKIFGYSSPQSHDIIDEDQHIKKNRLIEKKETSAPQLATSKTRTTGQFDEFMLSILTTVPQSMSSIGKKIEAHLQNLKAEKTTTTFFLSLHGLPRGLKKAIENQLGERVEITGTDPKYFVAIKEPEPANVQIENENAALTRKNSEAGSSIDFVHDDVLVMPVDPAFQQHVMASLEGLEGEIKLSTLSPRLTRYLKSIDEEPMSFRNFGMKYGIPQKSNTVLDILKKYFPDLIDFRKEGTVVYIWRK